MNQEIVDNIDILRKRQSQEWCRDTAEYFNSIKDSVRAGDFEALSAEKVINELKNLI